jgi:hypothetical protein
VPARGAWGPRSGVGVQGKDGRHSRSTSPGATVEKAWRDEDGPGVTGGWWGPSDCSSCILIFFLLVGLTFELRALPVQSRALPLESLLQSILFWLFWRWDLLNCLAGLASKLDPPDLSLPSSLDDWHLILSLCWDYRVLSSHLATQEAEIGRTVAQGQARPKVGETPSQPVAGHGSTYLSPIIPVKPEA